MGFGCMNPSAWAQDRYELPGAVSRRATASRLAGRAGPHEVLGMSITLGLRHREELDALLAAQQRLGAPEYHRWLSPAEFAAGFAPSTDEYEAVAQWLERQGFAVRRWENRIRLDFSGSVARVERAFGVRMNHYRHGGRTDIANENAPLLPIAFADSVEFMRLNTFPLAKPLVRVLGSGGSTVAMAPGDLQAAYDVLPVLNRGIDGSGQIIAVVARSDYNDSDISRFQQEFGGSALLPTKVFPSETPGVGAVNGVCRGIPNAFERQQCIQGEEGEVLLDVQWANAMAPGASVLVDIAGPGPGSDADIDQSLLDVVNHHPEAKMISISFGACERLDASDQALFAPMYAQAATQGQTVLVATGDDGADDCQDGGAAGVNVLATDPNVTAVGGTALDPGFDGNGNATGYVSESVWNDAQGASGGGHSILVRKPDYQAGPGVPADGMRAVPDVALLASPANSGYVAVVANRIVIVGGTSAATPAWAGVIALLNHASAVEGSGALNARLYALAAQQYTGAASGPFHDVVDGDNGFNGVSGFSAGPAYDVATGLGTPDVDLLVRMFATATCRGDCNGSNSVTVDEILLGVNILLGTVPLSQCSNLDADGSGSVTVDELLQAVDHLLNGC